MNVVFASFFAMLLSAIPGVLSAEPQLRGVILYDSAAAVTGTTDIAVSDTEEVQAGGRNYDDVAAVATTDIAVSDTEEVFQEVIRCGGNALHGYSTLSRDLFCRDLIGREASQSCAITLVGPDAELDCGGKTISQAIPADDSAVNCGVFDPSNSNFDPKNPVDLVKMKQDCGLPFAFGICLADGAKATNCNVQNFAVGIYADSSSSFGSSEVTSSTIANNRIGIFANADMIIGADTSPRTRVNVLKNGGTGIFAYGGSFDIDIAYVPRRDITMKTVWLAQNGGGQGSVGSSASGIRITSGGVCGVDLDDVISESNKGDGVSMDCKRGGEMRMKDINSRSNDGDGIHLTADVSASIMDLEGTVSSNANGKSGLAIRKQKSLARPVNTFKLNVAGEVKLDSNGWIDTYSPGFLVFGAQSRLDVVVGGGGSLQSCDNKEIDVNIEVGSGLTWDGDMTCVSSKSWVVGQTPNCVPCPSSST